MYNTTKTIEANPIVRKEFFLNSFFYNIFYSIKDSSIACNTIILFSFIHVIFCGIALVKITKIYIKYKLRGISRKFRFVRLLPQ